MAMHRKYYKGEGGGFPPSSGRDELVSACLPFARPCTTSQIYKLHGFVPNPCKICYFMDHIV